MSLTNRSLGLCNEAFLNCFISGLNPDIRRDVVAMCPPTLLHAVSLYIFLVYVLASHSILFVAVDD